MTNPAPATSVLETDFLCDGVMITVSTIAQPGWTMDQLADQHDKDVKSAKENCTPAPEPQRPIVSTWKISEGTMVYSSPSGTQPAHDADVVELKKIYPPSA